jgi:hypothetical protein
MASGLNMAGVTIMGVEEDRIVWAHLYMEPVEEDGQDIDEAMRTIIRGGQREGDERWEEDSSSYPTLEPEASCREPRLTASIHRSAWKVNSEKFGAKRRGTALRLGGWLRRPI